MQAAHCTSALLLLLLVCAAVFLAQSHAAVIDPNVPKDTSPVPKLPQTAAAPQQARECLLRTFKSTDAHKRERKVGFLAYCIVYHTTGASGC
jgi:hypothetical protein